MAAETFADLCREARGPYGEGLFSMSQDIAAHLCGVNVRTWQRWENGESCPRQTELRRFIGAMKFNDDVNRVFAAAAEQRRLIQEEKEKAGAK